MMKEKMKRAVLFFSAAAVMLVSSLSVFADEIYEPMPGDYQNVMPWVILIAAAVIGIQLIAGIILIIVFSIRKKKRRKGEQAEC